MKVPAWVVAEAAAFWHAAGGPEPFPRNLRGPIARSAFNLTIKELPGLSVHGTDRYLARLGVAWQCRGQDRPLRACLAAWAGAGIILLEADDPPEQRVFSLAHELAHFLGHYWGPRRRACRRLGDGITDVLDGKRPPTPAERVHALLAGLSLGPYVHLMNRGPRRELVSAETIVAEEEADRLAFELLAPAANISARTGGISSAAGRGRVEEVLRQVFGLAADQAEDYSRLLLPPQPQDPLLRRLGRPAETR
jgi:hypothetical protein